MRFCFFRHAALRRPGALSRTFGSEVSNWAVGILRRMSEFRLSAVAVLGAWNDWLKQTKHLFPPSPAE